MNSHTTTPHRAASLRLPGTPFISVDQAKAIERAVLKAMRGAALQRQQAVDEALAKVAKERDADIAKAVQAAKAQVRCSHAHAIVLRGLRPGMRVEGEP